MGSGEVKNAPARRDAALARVSRAGGLLIALVVGSALATSLLLVPRPVEPTEMPALVLDAAEVARVIARDARLAESAPEGPEVVGLWTLYRAHGFAETGPGETRGSARERGRRIETELATLRRERGDAAVAALRAQATRTAIDVLDRGGSEQEQREVLGVFPRMLERYSLVRDGRRVAPPFVVRVLYAARWNAVHGLATTDGMAPVELRAYWGWLALHATGTDPGRRAEALRLYGEAGGARVAEARGVLAWEMGQYDVAAASFMEAYETSGSIRLRNHALAADLARAASP